MKRGLLLTVMVVAKAIVGTGSIGAPHRAFAANPSCGIISQNGWTIAFASHVNGQGLVLTTVTFHSISVAARTATTIIRVQYNGVHGRIPDDLSDAVFNNSGLPCQKVNLSGGFKIYTTYIFGTYPSNGSYKYEDTYEMYDDGRMYHYVKAFGPGFYLNDSVAWYGPEFRHDYDASTGSSNFFDTWESSGWMNRTIEGNYYYQAPYLSPNFDWRNYVPGKQVTQAPYGAASSPDLYALRYHAGSELDDNGTGALASWVNGESISSADIVNWHLPYAFASPTSCQPSYPCLIGIYSPLSGY